MELTPGIYYYAIQVRDTVGQKIGIYKNKVIIDDYTSSDLMISDLQMADSISPTEENGTCIKKGLNVIPHSVRFFHMSQPVYLYFEIYNLSKDGVGRTHFRMNYILTSLKDTKDFVSKIVAEAGEMIGMESKSGELIVSYENTGTTELEVVYHGIDMKGSPPGKYRLAVSVEDLKNKTKTSKNIELELIP